MTPHFTWDELQCKCGCGDMKFTLVAVQALEALRVEFGVPMRISSGYRCPTHNMEVSSTGPEGPHTIHEAHNITVDVLEFGPNVYELLELAIDHDFSGIGLKQNGPMAERFIHLDRLPQLPNRPRPTIWTY